MSSSSSSSSEYWIYHERQEALLCGQHALNNLVQACVFSADSLAEIAHELDGMELAFMSQNNEGGIHSKDYLKRVAEGSGNVDPWGNFSIEVLRAALKTKYNLELPNIKQKGVGDSIEVTNMEGFICNRNEHWFAVRKINGHFWNLNSTEPRPSVISHFRLAAEIESLQNSGYSVFCVPTGLPPPCTSKSQRDRGLPQYWWLEDDLLRGRGEDATTGATDKWKNVGSGMRLDGKPVSGNGGSNGDAAGIGDLTEDEMMQMALAASLETPPQDNSTQAIPTPEEPPAGAKGAVRIQFRFPNGSRKVRRFLKEHPVLAIYSYVQDESTDSQGRNIELRYGFPPKDLQTLKDKTIGEAALAGESIQSRYV